MTTLSLLLICAAGAGGSGEAVLLDFTATWCGPCQQMNPIVHRLQRQGYPVRTIDIDRHRELAARFRVRSIPTFVLVVNGREVDRIVGGTSEAQLKRLLARVPHQEQRDDVEIAGRSGREVQLEAPSARQRPAAADREFFAPIRITSPRENPVRLVGDTNRTTTINLPFLGGNDDRERTIDQPRPRGQKAAGGMVENRRSSVEDRSAATPNEAFAASVRVRIRDGGKSNVGSGTIIDSRPGRSIVLTCGHIFRGISESARVEIDVFHGRRFRTYAGRVLQFDLETDLGVIAVPTEHALPAVSVARPGGGARRGAAAMSVGCNGGAPPSREQVRVVEINRFLGPDNVSCTGIPVQGRSGGGLFDAGGRLVGVCLAADQKARSGLYSGLKPIHRILDASGLTALYNPESGRRLLAGAGRQPDEPPRSPNENLVAAAHREEADNSASPPDPGLAETGESVAVDENQLAQMQAPQPAQPNTSDEASRDASVADENALEALKQAAAGEAEVICIIRPLKDPQAASRVVIINRASPKFLKYLQGELKAEPQPMMRSVTLCKEQAGDAAEKGSGPVSHRIIGMQRPEMREMGPDPFSVSPQRYRRSAAAR